MRRHLVTREVMRCHGIHWVSADLMPVRQCDQGASRRTSRQTIDFFVRFYYLYLGPLLGDIILTIKWAILVVAALHEQG